MNETDKSSSNVSTSPISISVGDKLSGYLAEYEALRIEMGWLLNGATQYQNFAMALIGPLVAILAWVVEKAPNLIVPMLLTVPFLFSLLGFLYFRQHEEVFIIAAYLSEYVRPRVRAVVQDNEVWGWEEFKASRNHELSKTAPIRILSTSTVIVILRSFLFILPGLLSLVTIVSYVASSGMEQFLRTYTTLSNIAMVVGFVLGCIVVLLLVAYLISRGDLSRRILRIAEDSHINIQLPRSRKKKGKADSYRK